MPTRKVDSPFPRRPGIPFNPKDPFQRPTVIPTGGPFSPQRREEEEEGNNDTKDEQTFAQHPIEKIFFNGDVLNITLPVEGAADGGEEELENEIEGLLGGVLRDAFQGESGQDGTTRHPPPKVKVTVDRVRDHILINAREEEQDESATITTKESRPGSSSSNGGRRPFVTPRPPRPSRPFTNNPLDGIFDFVFGQGRTPSPSPPPPTIVNPTDTRPVRPNNNNQQRPVNFVPFELEDAITRTPQSDPDSASIPPGASPARPLDVNLPSFVPDDPALGPGSPDGAFPLPDLSLGEVDFNVVEDEEEDAVDSYLNNVLFGGGRRSSANIVQATVVEDLDFARRIKDQQVS